MIMYARIKKGTKTIDHIIVADLQASGFDYSQRRTMSNINRNDKENQRPITSNVCLLVMHGEFSKRAQQRSQRVQIIPPSRIIKPQTKLTLKKKGILAPHDETQSLPLARAGAGEFDIKSMSSLLHPTLSELLHIGAIRATLFLAVFICSFLPYAETSKFVGMVQRE